MGWTDVVRAKQVGCLWNLGSREKKQIGEAEEKVRVAVCPTTCCATEEMP